MAMPLHTTPDEHRSMVSRVASILGAFSPGDLALSVSEIARRASLPKSTVARIVTEMVDSKLLERGPDQGVRLGIRMFEFGESATRLQTLKRLALPVMIDLRAALGLTIHLAVLEGTQVVYLEILRAKEMPELPSRVGGRMPAHATAVGKALLAVAPESTRDEILTRRLVQVTLSTITDPTALRKQLNASLARGYTTESEESRRGVACVATWVRGDDGAPLFAISAAGWVGQVNVARVSPALITAGRMLERAVAHPSVRISAAP